MNPHYFRHFRLFDEQDNLLPHGGVTVYVRRFSASGSDFPTDAEVTTAVCSHKDSYNKKIGRRIAFGRRHSVDAHVFTLNSKTLNVDNETLKLIAVQAINEVQFKGGYYRMGLVCKWLEP